MSAMAEQPWYAFPRDLEEARKRVREGAGAFMVIGAIQGLLGMFVMPTVLIDAVIWGLGGLWLYQSPRRTVAVAMAALALVTSGVTVANKLGAGLGGGNNIYLVPAMLGAAFYAVRGAFAFHTYSQNDPAYQPLSRWPSLLIGGLVVVLAGLFAYGSMLPPERILPGAEVGEETREYLVEQGVIFDDDRIVYFYAPQGDHEAAGSLLLDAGVVLYGEVDGEVRGLWLAFEDIEAASVEQDWDYHYVVVGGRDNEEIWLILPPDDEQVATFLGAVRERVPALR